MKSYGLLVIGSGPAGMSAALSYVEAGGDGPVLVVSADSHEPYQRPPLSKAVLVGAAPPEPSPIHEQPLPEAVQLRLGVTVTAVDTDTRTVETTDETLTYERLVIATGSRPAELPNVDATVEVHYLRSLEDARRLTTAAQHARSAVVIGSGFIGCEAAASLAARGIATTLLTPEAGPQETRLGARVAGQITEWLTQLGVTVRPGVSCDPPWAPWDSTVLKQS